MALIGVLIRFGYKKALLFLREKNYMKRPKFLPYINCLIYVYIYVGLVYRDVWNIYLGQQLCEVVNIQLWTASELLETFNKIWQPATLPKCFRGFAKVRESSERNSSEISSEDQKVKGANLCWILTPIQLIGSHSLRFYQPFTAWSKKKTIIDSH